MKPDIVIIGVGPIAQTMADKIEEKTGKVVVVQDQFGPPPIPISARDVSAMVEFMQHIKVEQPWKKRFKKPKHKKRR